MEHFISKKFFVINFSMKRLSYIQNRNQRAEQRNEKEINKVKDQKSKHFITKNNPSD